MNRRALLKLIGSGAAAAAAVNAAPAMPQSVSRAKETIRNLKITEMKFLRLRYPGKTPVKWNSIIKSGGGSPGMVQLELHTNEGIIGRSLPKARGLIENGIFPKLKGENPLDIERLWNIIGKVLGTYRRKMRVYAAGGYYEEGKGIAELVKEMEGYVSEGFHAVKMKISGAVI